MKKNKKMTCANKSVAKEEDGKISCVRYKNLKFRFLLFVLLIPIATGSFFIACNSEGPVLGNTEFETYLSISKPDFDFGRDWDNLSESDKTTFSLAQKRMDFTFDETGICTTKWTSSSQVNMSDELFNYFINIIAFTNEMTKKLSKEMPELNTPRLKSGSECDANNYNSRINSCAVKAIYTVYNALYSPSISYTTIDNWLCANDYYAYSSSCNCWGVKSGYIITVLSHFLEGNSVPVNVGNLTNTYSSQCILILKGSTQHAVIFTFYEGSASLIHFSDPSGTSSEDTCSINDIQYVFKATKNN